MKSFWCQRFHCISHPSCTFPNSEESTAIPGVGVDALLANGKLDRFKNGPIYWIDSADSNPCIGKSVIVLYYYLVLFIVLLCCEQDLLSSLFSFPSFSLLSCMSIL